MKKSGCELTPLLVGFVVVVKKQVLTLNTSPVLRVVFCSYCTSIFLLLILCVFPVYKNRSKEEENILIINLSSNLFSPAPAAF
jgi:hypothetical protein